MKQLMIPAKSLILLCGPAASGKSSFAAKFFKKTQVVSSDFCRDIICDNPHDQSVNCMAFRLLNYIVECRLKIGRLTVVDSTALQNFSRKELLTIADNNNFQKVIITFNTPMEICKEWNTKRNNVVPEDIIEIHNIKFEKCIKNLEEEGFNYIYHLSLAEIKTPENIFINYVS